MSERLISGELGDDDRFEASLRPRTLKEYIGQIKAKDNLQVFIEAARARQETLDHVLFFGPPGTRQNHPGQHHRQRNGCEHQKHLRTSDRETGRPGGHPDQS